METLKIGIVPVKRTFLPMEDAVISKNNVFEELKKLNYDGVEYVYIEDLVPDGVLYKEDQIDMTVNYLKEKEVDALFMLHCDFTTEEIVARVAAAIKKPVLAYGARDEGPDPETGARKRDTFCGFLASTKVLMRYGIPFSYIPNVYPTDPKFAAGWDKFVRVANVVKAFNHIRVAQIGPRPRPFMSVMTNEEALLNRFGIEIVPMSAGDGIFQAFNNALENRKDEVAAEKAELQKKYKFHTDEQLTKLAALKIVVIEAVKAADCNCVALGCWNLLTGLTGTGVCMLVGELSDLGIPVSCETDVNGAIGSLLLQKAALDKTTPFFADITIRDPDNDNSMLLWHCGPYPYSLKDESCTDPFLDENGRMNFPIRKSGDITICRFDCLADNYYLFADEGKAVDGPKTQGTYVWFEVEDWDAWEDKLVTGPYIHHVSGAYGNYADVIEEAVKFLPKGIIFDNTKK